MTVNWSELFTLQNVLNVIDVVIVSGLIYGLLIIVRNTRAMNLFKGILFIVAIKAFSFVLQLNTLNWVMDQIISWGVLATIIIFQPEIRRGLEHIGRGRFLRSRHRNAAQEGAVQLVDHLNTAVQYMAKRRIGALICIEMNNSLEEYIASSISVNGNVTSQLLINLFIPNTPLHDGALVLRGAKVVSASCYLPLSDSTLIPKELGTRHRAAIGLSEVTDALTIVVSEETGEVSIARTNNLQRNLTSEQLVSALTAALQPQRSQQKKTSIIQEFLDSFGGGGH